MAEAHASGSEEGGGTQVCYTFMHFYAQNIPYAGVYLGYTHLFH